MREKEKYQVLVVDDDEAILNSIRTQLEKLGYEVQTAKNGRSALNMARSTPPDLVVLDISFSADSNARPQGIDGIEVLRLLREAGDVPVLMLSATSISSVKIMAITIGADDYMTKPFDLQELSARIEAILRRTTHSSVEERVLQLRRLSIDPGKRRVTKDGSPVELTGIEFDILHTLARRPEHVFTREKLIEIAWKDESYCVSKAVDVHIGHIRKKLEDDPTHPRFIVTVRGTGYRFEDVATCDSGE